MAFLSRIRRYIFYFSHADAQVSYLIDRDRVWGHIILNHVSLMIAFVSNFDNVMLAVFMLEICRVVPMTEHVFEATTTQSSHEEFCPSNVSWRCGCCDGVT